ncbi:MAG: M16 family metallopeptidase [Planctomycetota bacterium]
MESASLAPGGKNKGGTEPARVFPFAVHRTTLDNGLKVLVVPTPSDGLVSYWSIVRTGSRDEVEEGVTGFAHFFEHMMFRGTEKLPGPEYDRIVNGLGASANAYTTDDYTAYHMSFSKADLPKVAEIEADRFQNLKYDEAQFTTEAGAVYGEYRKGRTSPFGVLFESLQNAAFDKHTYKHTTIGFERDIQAMPKQFEYSKSFFRRFYRPENVVILVTGDVDPAKATALVKKEYGGWKTGYTAPKVPVEPAQTAQRRIDVPFDGQTLPILTLNFKGPAFQPKDKPTVAGMLIGELCFGETSPLYKKLVLDEQRVEGLFQSFDVSRDPSLWSAFARVKDPADVPAVEAELWKAIADFRKTPVDEKRLDAVRSNMRYGFVADLGTADDVASTLARYVGITGDLACVNEFFATLDTVTPEDVRKAANAWMLPERCTVAVLRTKGEQPTTMAAESAARDASAAATNRVSQAPVLLPVPQDPQIAFKLWFQVGSQDDPKGQEGIAALTGALISEGGTKRMTYDKILEQLFPLAAAYYASVDREMTVVSGSVHKDNLDAYTELLVEAITKPGFRKDDFERIRDQMISGIENTLRYSSDEDLGKATLAQAVFAGTPYATIDEGTVASLRAMTLEDVHAFHKTHFTRDNLVIGLGGGYPESLPGRLATEFGRLPAGKPEPTPAPQPAKIEGRHVTFVEKEGPSTSISFGYPIDVRRGSREFYALWIANSWLGEHRNSSSHLYEVIRELRGLNYGDYSYIEAYPNGGRRTMPPTGVGRRAQMFEVWVRSVPRENAIFALRAALREVDTLAKNGLTKEQFESTRKFLKGYSLHFAESTADRLGYAIDDRYFGLQQSHLATFRKMMDEITFEEVNAAVKKHFHTNDLVIAMVTQDAQGLKDLIVSGAATPVTYPKDAAKSAEILAEDKLIESWPLSIPEANVTIVPVKAMFEGEAPKTTMR